MSHRTRRRGRSAAVAVVAAFALVATGQPAIAGPPAPAPAAPQQAGVAAPEVRESLRHDTSRKFSDLVAEKEADSKKSGEARRIQSASPGRDRGNLDRVAANPAAAVGTSTVQTADVGTADFPEFATTFDGIDNLDGVLPPDTNGDVGPNHYVQTVNTNVAVYSKAGATLLAPVAINTLWAGFGGPCQANNDGDPVVLYDEAADRWMVTQFALGASDGHHQCMAISQTADPTGAYHRYDFLYHATRINDYPKYGIWPDAYYMTTNEFAPSFVGAGAVAFEREKMLAGQPAKMVYFHLGPDFGGLLPADAEGLSPPAGAPNPFTMFDDDSFGVSPTDRLLMWDFHVDWATPANSTFGNNLVPNRFLETVPFDSNLCNYARNCIAQMGTTTRVDAISDRLMYRAGYRNFGGHASIVLNHSVDANGADRAGVRWYELRSTTTGWTIHQQGTYSPDAENRWMASAAMDVSGNIAIGYSTSSATSFPSIRVAGRLATDPLGQLAQGERLMFAGTGAQTHSSGRWGDYSSMSVDPTDGCTFWYTNQYNAVTGVAPWRTRIGSAKFPGCTAGPTGSVSGRVTNAAGGAPIAGATVGTGGTNTVTGADGRYSLILPSGTHTLTATAYGFAAGTATVTVTDGGSVTQDFALTALPVVTVSGRVTDGSGKGYPLYARIDVGGRPGGPVFTNPATGRYSFEAASGTTYQFTTKVQYAGYQTLVQSVAVGATNKTHNIAVPVDASACVARGYQVGFGAPVLSETFDTTSTPPGWTVVDRTAAGAWRFDDPEPRGNLTGGTGTFAIADGDFIGPGKTMDTDLITPPLDLTGMASPRVRFNSDYRALSGDSANVDVSLDGGTTWMNVNTWTTSRRGPVIEEIALTPAAGQSNVLVRFRHFNTFDWWWEVDNVQVLNRACLPLPGGLVVGTVTDRNTSAGLNGAKVTSDAEPADSGVSAATPDDPNLGDGFYSLFSSLVGDRSFTASKAPYEALTKPLAVVDNGTKQLNFALKAGRLTVTPASLEAHVPMGATRSSTVTVKNTGTGTATVELLERSGTFEMLGKIGSKLAMYRMKHGPELFTKTGPAGAEAPVAPPAVDDAWTRVGNFPVNIFDHSTAILDGKIYSVGGGIGTGNERKAFVYDPIADAWTALPDMGTGRAHPQVAAVDGKLYVLSGWAIGPGLVNTVEVYDPATNAWTTLPGLTQPKPRVWAGVATIDDKIYTIGGCTDDNCARASDVFSFDPATNTYTDLAPYPQAVSFVSCGAISGKVYCAGGAGATTFKTGFVYDPAANAWSPIADLPIDLWGGAYATANGMLVLMGGQTANSAVTTNRSFAYDPANNTWIDLPNAQFARFRTAGACGVYKIGGSPTAFVGSNEVERLGGLDECAAADDVGWLSANPVSFTLAPGQSRTVTVTLDATVAAGIAQPGKYTAAFGVKSNTPYPVPAIGVTMHVDPPPTWGKIQGTVLGQPCTGGTVPIPAFIRINKANNPEIGYSIRADNQGRYGWWLPAGRYEVIIAKDNWVPKTYRLRVDAGFIVTRDATLIPFTPC